MGEYINRKILVDLVLSKLKFMGDARIMNRNDEKVLSEIDGYEKAINAVHELILDKDLIEDVQPVKHGTWRKDEQGYDVYVECSECGLNLSISNYIENEWREILKYCPTCGVRMDGEQNDT